MYTVAHILISTLSRSTFDDDGDKGKYATTTKTCLHLLERNESFLGHCICLIWVIEPVYPIDAVETLISP